MKIFKSDTMPKKYGSRTIWIDRENWAVEMDSDTYYSDTFYGFLSREQAKQALKEMKK